MTRFLRFVIGAVLQLGGAALAIANIARAVYYPFWAADASHTELARSWGGPSPVGATVVHWLVGSIFIALGIVLFWLGAQVRRRSRRRSAAA
jgi:hypothetical protein